METKPEIPLQQPGFQVRLIEFPVSSLSFAIMHSKSGYIYSIVAVIDGAVDIVLKESTIVAQSFQICFLKEECIIKPGAEGTAKFWTIRFTEVFARVTIYKVIAEASFKFLNNNLSLIAPSESTFKILKKLVVLLHKHQSVASENSGIICELTFNLFLSCLTEVQTLSLPLRERPPRRKEYIAMQFFKLVNMNATKHHDVRYYAGELCMTQGNLSKVIREVTGKAAKPIIEEILVNLTKDMLENSLESIYVIAEELGFKSSSAFINFFRLKTGQTPNEYRNRNTR